jgi:hypothetical protein
MVFVIACMVTGWLITVIWLVDALKAKRFADSRIDSLRDRLESLEDEAVDLQPYRSPAPNPVPQKPLEMVLDFSWPGECVCPACNCQWKKRIPALCTCEMCPVDHFHIKCRSDLGAGGCGFSWIVKAKYASPGRQKPVSGAGGLN